jgi:hypothetical protein
MASDQRPAGSRSGGREDRADREARADGGRPAAAWLTAGAVALAVLGAGCADLPGSSAVRYAGTQLGAVQEQELPQQIAEPPGRGWNQAEIVAGFLAASASFAHDHAVAREYLTPRAAKSWHPGWAATVVEQPPLVKLTRKKPPVNVVAPGSQTLYAAAKVTGPSLATLTDSGQYLKASGARAKPFLFYLQKIGGQWRIYQLPSSLILTQAAFETDYVPRDLYFLGPHSLVPDPVFVPQQESPNEPATGLVRALVLQSLQDSWLSGAATTGFPTGTTLLGVSITATSAVVNLGGAAAHASRQALTEMEAQLVWTLTGSSYTPSAVTSVQLKINGRAVSQKLLLQQQFSKWLPARSASRVYFLDRYRKIGVLTAGRRPARLAWPVRDRITRIAVAPGGAEVAGIVPGRGGCSVITGPPGRRAQVMSRRLSGGACTALSVDDLGNTWVAAGSHVWFLPQDGGAALPVVTQGVPPGDAITDLRVAPDGVRVAMIVRPVRGAATILLGAINHTPARSQFQIGPQMQAVGADVPNPSMLTWYNADYIVVLSDAGLEASQLYQVPLNGGSATAIPTPVGRVSSVAASGTQAGLTGSLIAGMVPGVILSFDPALTSWTQVANGTSPVYPG